MKFTRKTDYALRAMQNLARRYYRAREEGLMPKPVPVQAIAKDTELSLRFLHGIMAKLSRDGLLKSVPGPKGGIALSRAPEAISILERMIGSPDRWLSLVAHFLVTESGLAKRSPRLESLVATRTFETLDL